MSRFIAKRSNGNLMKSEIKEMPEGQMPVTDLSDAERQPCEIWTRVMGYFRPLSEFNIGKKAEFLKRKYFDEHKINNRN